MTTPDLDGWIAQREGDLRELIKTPGSDTLRIYATGQISILQELQAFFANLDSQAKIYSGVGDDATKSEFEKLSEAPKDETLGSDAKPDSLRSACSIVTWNHILECPNCKRSLHVFSERCGKDVRIELR